MKILVFSDTHLYLPFDQKKFNFLKKIISKSDQVIINGDFFDGYMVNFNDFVNSQWNQLFSLLKSKKAVYIYGNHDKKEFSDKKVSLFSNKQTCQLELKLNNKNFLFEHGQKTRPTPDMMFKISWKNMHYGMIVVHFVRNLFIKIFGKLAVQIIFGHSNNGSKRYIKRNYKPKNNEYYIIGHNHWAEIDEKNHFAASGMILYGFAQYLTIDSMSGKITIHEEWYDR
ncbi:MAG: metallophosphoesterase [Patescibacteria group bacterium]